MINDKEFEDFVFLQALENAVSFKGKANPKAMIGKCMPKFPEMKKDMAHYTSIINNLCGQVNDLSLNVQIEKVKELNPKFFDEKKQKKEPNKKDGLPDLPNTENGVVVRFPPAPSGHLHLGHLFGIVANYELKNKYGGKFIVRLEDTNPENIDISNYENVIEDIKWICDGNVDEVFYQSDRLEIYYKYLRTLVETGNAYICKCDPETFKAYTDAKETCPCAQMDQQTQNRKLDKFMNGRYKVGEAVIRARADINNKNPALRTFPLARINENKHARTDTKYRVWPNYNLACAIDDSLMELTHVVRGKDLEIGEERQKMLHKALGLKSPEYFHYGRMKFIDLDLSKTKLSEKIKSKEFTGWDDPRVPSILSHKKRGYKAEAFRKFILSLGISKRDSKITTEEYYKGLDFFNKQILEKEADRAFFVHNPKKVHISNVKDYPTKEIILPKHPEDKSKGERHFKLVNEYYIDSIDFDNIEKGDLIRLMHFGNFLVNDKKKELLELEFKSKEYDKNIGIKSNIHFVPLDADKCQIIMQDNSKLNGLCEDLDNTKENSSIQFERFGFIKYDHKEEDKRIFYFTHR